MTRYSLLVCSFAALFTLNVVRNCSAQVDNLLNKIPGSANALVVIDVEQVLSTPMARKEGWVRKTEDAYMRQATFLPPEAEQIVIGGELNIYGGLTPLWEVAVMNLSESMSMRSIARAEGGYIDKINNNDAVWTPSQAYIAEVGAQQLGVLYPDHRQHFARWLEFAKVNPDPTLSPYLVEAAGRLSKTRPIVMAIDITNGPQRHKLEERLSEFDFLKGKESDFDAIVETLLGLNGATLTVELDDKATGQLHVEFDRDITLIKPFARKFFDAVIDENGAALDDFDDWKEEFSYNTMTLSGPLAPSSLRLLLSVLEVPTTKFSSLAEESTQDGSDTKVIVKSSQAFYSSMSNIFQDLRKSSRTENKNNGLWVEKYARKIDRLPILHVDEELLAYGATVAETLREVARTMKTGGVRAGVRKTRTYGNYHYGSYNNRSYNNNADGTYRDPSNERVTIRAEERAKSTQAKFKSFEEIENGLVQMRQKMTAKYGVEF